LVWIKFGKIEFLRWEIVLIVISKIMYQRIVLHVTTRGGLWP